MEKIKVKGKLYEIRSIQTTEPHVLQIIFAGTPPTNGEISLSIQPVISSVQR